MGMSASQARYLNLIARQNNLEYQGQQINQERTILSQQCTALYNSLLEMKVPTPPSTSDFTTIEYTGNDGSTRFTLGTIRPDGSAHSVEIKKVAPGASLAVKYGTAVVSAAPDKIKAVEIKAEDINYKQNEFKSDENITPNEGDYFMQRVASPESGDLSKYYVMDNNGVFKPATGAFNAETAYYTNVKKEDGVEFNKEGDNRDYCYDKINAYISNISDIYVVEINGDVRKSKPSDFIKVAGGYQLKNDNTTKYVKLSAEGNEYDNADKGKTMIAGEEAYSWEQAKTSFPNLDWDGYERAISNKYQGDNSVSTDDFMVYVTVSESGIMEPHFAFSSDVTSMDGRATVYDYMANGQYVESKVTDGCNLTFDASGRITAIDIPITDEVTGSIVAYNTIALEASTKTDEAAYKDAYAKYEYAQYEYDKKNQEINAKTEIIQQEDRNLELKLQRLDNERTQITTEIEALDKVINDNIESSYKTFSG